MRVDDPSNPDQPGDAPEGPEWSPLAIDSPYARALGPLFVAAAPPRLWLMPGAGLTNLAGFVHGGALATLADLALFVAVGSGRLEARAVTITLDCAYLAPARPGTALLATAEVTGGGRSIVFAGGRIEAAGAPVLTFSGTLRRLADRRG